MGLKGDLSAEVLAEVMPNRAIRSYPALLSTQSDALAWARSGAPEGALVVAEYQASPRGRAGLEWRVEHGVTLGFSLISRPRLPVDREGWLYTVATAGLSDVMGEDAKIAWPDEVHSGDTRAAAVGIDVELGPTSCDWAVVNVVVPHAASPRAHLLAELVDAIERRLNSASDAVLGDYLSRCETLGRRVTARLIPMGPDGVRVTGKAVGSLMDGALLIETDNGHRVAVRPQNLGLLEPAESPPAARH